MKNTMVSNKELKIKTSNTVISIDEICLVCGTYQPDGEVCINCQKQYDVYKPKISYEQY